MTFSVASYPQYEAFQIRLGVVELEDADGTVRRIGPGQGAYLPRGWAGVWRTIEPTDMTYVILKALPVSRDRSSSCDWEGPGAKDAIGSFAAGIARRIFLPRVPLLRHLIAVVEQLAHEFCVELLLVHRREIRRYKGEVVVYAVPLGLQVHPVEIPNALRMDERRN